MKITDLRIVNTIIPFKDKWKFAFTASFIMGMLVHFYMFTHNLLSHDAAGTFYYSADYIDHGRWFLKSICSLSSYFQLPWVTGLLSVFYLSISIVILVEIFDIENKISIVVIAGFLVTFPSLAATFSYVFVADGYMFGVLCACLSVLMVQKIKFGYIWGAIPLAFSLGVYQAYLSIAILLIMLLLIVQILDSESSVRSILIKIREYLLFGILGVVIDFICIKAALFITNSTLIDYQGASSINSFSLSIDNIMKSATMSVQGFAAFLKWPSISGYGIIKYVLMVYAVIFILTVLLVVRKNKIYNSPIKIVLLLLILAFTPFALEIIRFVIPDVWYHMLMYYPWCILFISVPVLHERYINMEKIYTGGGYCLLSNLAVICASIIIFVYFLISNIAYFNMDARMNKTYGMTLRMVDRIEQTDDFTFETPVVFIGSLRYSAQNKAMDYITGMIGTEANDILGNDWHYKLFIDHYLNLKFPTPDPQVIESIKNSEQFQDMPLWPAKDSGQMIDGTIVVKVNDNW